MLAHYLAYLVVTNISYPDVSAVEINTVRSIPDSDSTDNNASVGITLDIYNYVLPDLQEAAEENLDRLLHRTQTDESVAS